MMRHLVVAGCLLLLAACSVQPPRDAAVPDPEQAYQERKSAITAFESWTLAGRLGLSDGKDGGSGRLDWRVEPGSANLQFRGALGKGAWQITATDAMATLLRADGSQSTAPSVSSLASEELGWSVPVDSLNWWVRGVAAPGSKPIIELDESGLPLFLEQDGWRVEFERWDDSRATLLPRKLKATRANFTLKLAISRWQLATDVDS